MFPQILKLISFLPELSQGPDRVKKDFDVDNKQKCTIITPKLKNIKSLKFKSKSNNICKVYQPCFVSEIATQEFKLANG